MKSEYLTKLASYIGYKEDSDGSTVFGKSYDKRHSTSCFAKADWCMMFLAECARYCDISSAIIPDTASCPTCYNFAKSANLLLTDKKEAKAGDIVLYMWSNNTDGKADHVGIVYGKSGDSIGVIEGNYNDSVAVRTISCTDSRIMAIWRPQYKEATIDTGLEVGDTVKLKSTAVVYGSTTKFSSWVYDAVLYVRAISGDKITVSTQSTGAVTGDVVYTQVEKTSAVLAVGDKVKLTSDATVYGTTKKFSAWVYKMNLYIRAISGDKVTVSVFKGKGVTGSVAKKYLKKV